MPLTGNPIYATVDPTPTFGSRPTTAFQEYHNLSNLVISNQTFNQFSAGADLLGFYGCSNITVQDCDFGPMPADNSASGRKAIYFQGCAGTLTIIRCRFLNPAHDAIQLNTSHMVGQITDCRIRGTTANSEDLISLFQSGGVDATHRLKIWNVRIDGNDIVTGLPGYTSSSGTGINIGDDALLTSTGFVDIYDCTIYNAGQAGIAVAGGNDQTIDGNIMYSIQTALSNVGMSIWMNGGSTVCQAIEARQNRVHWINSGSGLNNGLFQNGNCGTIANLSDNNFNDTTINPANLVVNLG
jgi:hypothetical protein